jgi:hypothetical protein
MLKSAWAVAAAIVLSSLLCACGGDADRPPALPGSVSSDPSAAIGDAPSGLMVGYYQEDASTNPEDPMPGTFYMNLPVGSGSYNGQMYYTYVGCQSENVGTISGHKNGDGDISGTWGGTVDGHTVGGPYEGIYNASTGLYEGTYANAGGKLDVEVEDCIQYFVAPNGTYKLFPVEVSWPSTFGLTKDSQDDISWTNPNGAANTFVTVIDREGAETNGPNAILFQELLPVDLVSATDEFDASGYKIAGRERIVVVVSLNAQGGLLAYSSIVVK